jgi:hypothetical protein
MYNVGFYSLETCGAGRVAEPGVETDSLRIFSVHRCGLRQNYITENAPNSLSVDLSLAGQNAKELLSRSMANIVN